MPAGVLRRTRRELPTLLSVLALAVLTAWHLHRFGTPVDAIVAFGLAALLTQVLPGMVIWRAVRDPRGWWLADLVFGAALGAMIAIPAQVLDVVLGTSFLGWALAWVVALGLLAVKPLRARVRAARTESLPWWWAVAVAVASLPGLAHATRAFGQPLPGEVAWGAQNVDRYYHQALTAEVLHRFPPDTPQVAGEPLAYHWFSNAWAAQLTATSRVDLDLVMARLTPAFVLLLVSLAVAFLAVRVSGRAAAGPLAAVAAGFVATIGLPSFWPSNGLVRQYSPSMAFSLLLGFCLVQLLLMRWRGTAPGGSWVLVLLLAVATSGSKGSVLPVLVVGGVLAAVAGWLGKVEHRRRIVLDTGLLVAAIAASVTVLFRGNDGGLRLEPFTAPTLWRIDRLMIPPPDGFTTVQVAAVDVFLLVTLLLPMSAALVLLFRRGLRADPVLWLLAGATLAGAGTLIVFMHPGLSMLYFWFSGAPLGAVAAVWGLVELVRGRPFAVLSAALGLAAALVVVGPLRDVWPPDERHRALRDAYLGLGLLVLVLLVLGLLVAAAAWLVTRRRAALVPVVVAAVVAGLYGAAGGHVWLKNLGRLDDYRAVLPTGPTDRDVVSADQVAALRHIAEHSEPDDLVMTNRHCAPVQDRDRCDHRVFTVAAYSELRVLVEGWAYTRKANAIDPRGEYNTRNLPFWDPELLELNDGFYTDPTRAKAQELYDLGVRWVYVDTRLPHEDLGGVADEVFRSPTALVYRLDPS
jgi:hypothetical protein